MATIRRASVQDAPLLLPLVEQYWRFEGIEGFDPRRLAQPLARLLSHPGLGNGWIAYENNAVAGYLLAVYVFSLENAGLTAEIDELFVLPAYRGRRVGRALIRAAEGEIVRTGCTCVSLQLARANDAARAFYHHHGYSERSDFELLEKRLPEASNTGGVPA